MKIRNLVFATAGAASLALVLSACNEPAGNNSANNKPVNLSTPNNAVWIDTSAGLREQSLSAVGVGGTSGSATQGGDSGAAAPGVKIPHQVAPIEGGEAAPAVQIPHQVPPDEL